jgi:dihydroorotate dehydrogenase (NAD+) catalytic subunit
VAECAAAVTLPIVGMGGIETAEHARAFLAAGARAIAVGTALFRNPLAAVEIVDALAGPVGGATAAAADGGAPR